VSLILLLWTLASMMNTAAQYSDRTNGARAENYRLQCDIGLERSVVHDSGKDWLAARQELGRHDPLR